MAIKIIRKDLQHRETAIKLFQQESLTVSRLQHPNIVTVYDAAESDGLYFLAMEYIRGRTLRELLKENISLDFMIRIWLEVAEGVSAAHEIGIVHRDIKPENILITKEGTAKVLDFGISKILEDDSFLLPEGPSDGQAASTVMGTQNYMSPEQRAGVKTDARTDVFSIGIVFFEMLTGKTIVVENQFEDYREWVQWIIEHTGEFIEIEEKKREKINQAIYKSFDLEPSENNIEMIGNISLILNKCIAYRREN